MYIYIYIVMTPLHTPISETYKIVNWSMILWCFFCWWYLLLCCCCCCQSIYSFFFCYLLAMLVCCMLVCWYGRSVVCWCAGVLWLISTNTAGNIYSMLSGYAIWIYPNKEHENREMCTNMYRTCTFFVYLVYFNIGLLLDYCCVIVFYQFMKNSKSQSILCMRKLAFICINTVV